MKFRTAVIAAFIGCFIAMGGVLYLSKPSNAALKAVTAPSGLQNAGAVAITGGSITGVTGVPYVWKSYHIPIIIAPTGTMANNGAVTLGTALDTTYAAAYLVLPAGSIAAGVPAATDIYYVQMSSTTVGTVCNNLLSANLDSVGGPTIPGSCTAFATTGPGAFTGITAAVTLLTLALPASTISTTGILDVDLMWTVTTSAGNKLMNMAFGGTSVRNANTASTTYVRDFYRIRNRNSASVQEFEAHQGSGSNSAKGYMAINTGNAVNITFAPNHAGAATDFVGIESIQILVTN